MCHFHSAAKQMSINLASRGKMHIFRKYISFRTQNQSCILNNAFCFVEISEEFILHYHDDKKKFDPLAAG